MKPVNHEPRTYQIGVTEEELMHIERVCVYMGTVIPGADGVPGFDPALNQQLIQDINEVLA